MGSSRSSANRSRSSERSLPEARQVIGERLRARKDEIEQELLARVGAFSQDESVDPEYAMGLRDSVPVALEYGIECIESSERSAPPLPTSLYAQARLAARNDVKLDVVINRYMGGYTLLDSFLEEVAVIEGVIGSAAYREIHRVSSMLIERLITDIGEQYHDEIQKQATSPESTRIKQVRDLLDGKPVDTTQFSYDFGGFHIGLIAKGPGVDRAIKSLAKALDCICPPGRPSRSARSARDEGAGASPIYRPRLAFSSASSAAMASSATATIPSLQRFSKTIFSRNRCGRCISPLLKKSRTETRSCSTHSAPTMRPNRGLATTLLDEQGGGVFVTSRRVIVGIAPDQVRDVVAEGPESAVEIPVISGSFTWRDHSAYPPERLKLVKHGP